MERRCTGQGRAQWWVTRVRNAEPHPKVDFDYCTTYRRIMSRRGSSQKDSRHRELPQMLFQKPLHRFVEFEAIFLVMKAVAFVVLDNIFHVDAVLVQRG